MTRTKVMAVVGFALLLSGCAQQILSAREKKTISNEGAIREQLIENFQHYNDGWFDGALPQNTKILYYDAGPDFAIGETDQSTYADGTVQYVISVNSYYDRSPREALFTEVHELCHEAIDMKGGEFEEHGPRWQGCMQRLAAAGAFENLW